MTRFRAARAVVLAGSAALITGLLWLDANRAGPINSMTRCNLLLSRAGHPAADVLIIGSSRSGVALDPVAMERVLTEELGRQIRVDRLSLARNPLRAMSGLLQYYLEARGSPRIMVLEIMFMTQRSVDNLASRGLALTPEDYIYRRDVNLLDFTQLLAQPSVAMPFTAGETVLDLWSQRLRGVVLRSGALVYAALREPGQDWKLSDCAREDWTREPSTSSNFAFSYAEFEPRPGLAGLIEALESDVARKARARELRPWQSNSPTGIAYPYDFAAVYRRGEVSLLRSMIKSALDRGAEVLLVPLPLYGYELNLVELRDFVSFFSQDVRLFDLYGAVRSDIDRLWYDDAHVELFPVGALTTALMARRLLQSQAFHPRPPKPDG